MIKDYSEDYYAVNPSDIPMLHTEYYQWLDLKDTGNRLQNKKDYLAALGFRFGIDKVTQEVLDSMRWIEQHWWYTHYGNPQRLNSFGGTLAGSAR